MQKSYNRTFFFYTDVGMPTDKRASDLIQFYDVIKNVDVKSLEFHLYREDFEKWLRFIGENWMAMEVAQLRRNGLRGEQLRENLSKVTKKCMEND